MPVEPLEVSSVAPESNAELAVLIDDIRRQADRFVFLAGGAGTMDAERLQPALGMLDALAQLPLAGYRFAVGDATGPRGLRRAPYPVNVFRSK